MALPAPVLVDATSVAGSETILVVEDQDAIRVCLSRFLRGRATPSYLRAMVARPSRKFLVAGNARLLHLGGYVGSGRGTRQMRQCDWPMVCANFHDRQRSALDGRSRVRKVISESELR
jgi:hypothetical protein